MRFTKMNGAGNDFILINTIDQPMPRLPYPELARSLCDRRRSLGADALIHDLWLTGPTAWVADGQLLDEAYAY